MKFRSRSLVSGGRSTWPFFAGALLLAGLAFWLTLRLIGAYAPSVRVLALTRDIPPYTPLQASDIRMVTVPAAGLPSDTLSQAAGAVGHISRGFLPAGEILRTGHLSDATRGAVAEQLQGSGLSGLALAQETVGPLFDRLSPGDRLEFIAVMPVRSDKLNSAVAVQVATGAPVLEVIPPPKDGASDAAGAVIIGVSDAEAARIALAQAEGKLFVNVLPSGVDQANPMVPISPESLTADGR